MNGSPWTRRVTSEAGSRRSSLSGSRIAASSASGWNGVGEPSATACTASLNAASSSSLSVTFSSRKSATARRLRPIAYAFQPIVVPLGSSSTKPGSTTVEPPEEERYRERAGTSELGELLEQRPERVTEHGIGCGLTEREPVALGLDP